MFVSFDDGRTWSPFQLNLARTPITDLKVHQKDLVLSTQGRSFWILDDLSPMHEWADAIAAAPSKLLAPREAIRTRYAGGFGGVESSRTAPDAPEYPPVGAAIHDGFAAAPQGEGTLEMLDAAGKVVRAFSSEAPGERTQPTAEPSMRAPAMERTGTSRLPKAAGLNRFVWDFAYPGPWDAGPRSGRNGPLATPGRYQVRLTADGRTETQPLVVRADPRLAEDGVTLAVLQEQLAHNLRARELVSEVNRVVARVEEARRRLGSAGGAAADTLQKLNALRAKLVTPAVRYSKPELQTHIQYMYSMSMRADQKVGRDAVERYRVLRRELDARVAELRGILGAEGVADGGR